MAKNTPNAIDLINQLRTEPSAPQEFRDMIPVATDTNIAEVASGFLRRPENFTYYLGALYDRVGLVMFKTPRFNNPFNRLRKSDVELGETIQEIFVRLCEERDYHMDNPTEMLATENPDLDTVFYILNRKKFFKRTLYNTDLRQYFLSWQKLNDFTSSVIETLYTSDEYHQFNYVKQAIAKYAEKDLFYKIQMTPVTDDTTGSNLIQQMQATATLLGFISDKYNARRVETATPYDNLVLFITADLESKLGVLVQAKVFNLEKAEYLANRIVVDDLGDPNIQAILCSKDWLNLRNYLVEGGAFYNPEILATNHWYHHWEYIYTSQLENAVAFTLENIGTDAVTSVTVSPSTATLSKGAQMQFMATVIATGNATKNVTWTLTGGTSANTGIDPRNGLVMIGADETGTDLTITATSDFDETKTGTATITIAQ